MTNRVDKFDFRHGVFINPVGAIGGAERILLMAIEAWVSSDRNRSATLITLSDGPLIEKAKTLGAKTIVLQLPAQLAKLGDTQFRRDRFFSTALLAVWSVVWALPQFARFLIQMRKILKADKPDFIHSNGLKSHILLGLIRPTSRKQFWHLHDFYSQRPAVGRILRLVGTERVSGIAISNAVAEDVHRVLPNLKIITVRNGVDTHAFLPRSEVESDAIADLDKLSGKLSEKQNIIRIGLVATYANWKGHHTFLEAFAGCVKSGKLDQEVIAYIIGGPIYTTIGSQVTHAELEEKARKLGILDQVQFVSFQSDTAPIYRALDIVVHASTRPEPFGLTIAEAMSCSRSVIASKGGGASEIFDDGVNALGHLAGDVADLSDAMLKLILSQALRQKLGESARVKIVDQFSKERFAEEFVQSLHT